MSEEKVEMPVARSDEVQKTAWEEVIKILLEKSPDPSSDHHYCWEVFTSRERP